MLLLELYQNYKNIQDIYIYIYNKYDLVPSSYVFSAWRISNGSKELKEFGSSRGTGIHAISMPGLLTVAGQILLLSFGTQQGTSGLHLKTLIEFSCNISKYFLLFWGAGSW
jgi:hypothetical protein